MEKVDRNFLVLSAVYGLLGMGIGLYMASVETFAVVGSLLVILSALQFVVAAWRA